MADATRGAGGDEVSVAELGVVHAAEKYEENPADRPDLPGLVTELERIRHAAFAVNQGGSERGMVAVGVPGRSTDGEAVAGLSVSTPSVRRDLHALPSLLAALEAAAQAWEEISRPFYGRDEAFSARPKVLAAVPACGNCLVCAPPHRVHAADCRIGGRRPGL
jgi:hypothetical protein